MAHQLQIHVLLMCALAGGCESEDGRSTEAPVGASTQAVSAAPTVTSSAVAAESVKEDPKALWDALKLEQDGPEVRHRLGLIKVEGDYKEDDARKVFDDAAQSLKACHWTALKRDPSVEGRMAPRLTLSLDGSVVKAANSSTDMKDDRLIECVVLAFQTMKFPPPNKEGVVLQMNMVLSLPTQ